MKPSVRPISKKTRILSKNISSLLALGALAAVPALPSAHAGNSWTGGGTTSNWSDDGNWGGAQPAYGTLTFDTGGTQGTTSILNQSYSENMLLWTGTSSWTINSSNGAILSLFDNGGVQAKIENQSTGSVTINAPVTFAATAGAAWGEINAVNGDITFASGGPLTVNGSAVAGIKMFGAGHTTTFNNTVSAAGKWFATTGATAETIAIGGAFTSGDFYLMNGSTLKLNTGGTLTTTGLRLGGDFGTTLTQDLTKGATFQLTAAAGGQTFGSTINSVTGNTSGALLVDSQNTSGTNTLGGNIFLDSPLTLQQAAGGTLAITSIVSNASSLTKAGNGVLTLSGVNTYTGGTTLNAGTININTTTALGTGALNANAGSIDNTTAAALTLSAAKTINLNGSLTVVGTKDLNFNGGVLALGNTAGTRTLTVNAGTFSIGNFTGGAGVNLSKTGAGNLALTTGTNNASTILGVLDIQAGKVQVIADTTIGGLSGGGTIENNGAASKWLFINNPTDTSFSGTIQGNPANAANVRLGLVKSGVGALTLSGTNSFLDNFNVVNGVVNITGNSTTGYATGGTANIGGAANLNGVLNINGGTLNALRVTSPSLVVGGAANARGFLNLTSGTITSTNQFNIGNGNGAAGTNPYAIFNMSGGTATSGSWLVVGANNDRGIYQQSGGAFTVATNRATIGAGGNGSIGEVNISGGSLTVAAGGNTGIFLGENGTGTITLSGTGGINLQTNLGATSGTMQFAGNATSLAGTFNLDGGTLTTFGVTKGTSTATGVYRFNFNGGLLKANGANGAFFANLALTTAYVNGASPSGAGGANIDDGGFAVTVAQPLLAPTGSGVSSIAVATGGAGYLDRPMVTLTGGTGTGATAIAIVSGGVVTGFTITNPGVGYTAGDVLTATLFGGGAATAATVGTIALTANTSGGLTKTGNGNLTLSGASTFTGNVLVSAGTLTANLANVGNPTFGPLGNAQIPGRTITVNSGATLSLTANDTFGNALATAANLPSLIINGTMKSTRYNQIGAITLNGATLTSASTDGGNYQGYQFLGDVTVGGTAPSFISSTAGANFNSNDLSTATNFIVADVTGNANTDLMVSAPLRNQSNNFANAAGGFVKSGAGKMELTDTSTYTGATSVTNGILHLSGTGSINSTSGITVNGTGAKLLVTSTTTVSPTVTLTSGTLDGTGTLTTVNVASLATNTIANGNGTAGSPLFITGLTFAGDAKVNLLLNSLTAGLITSTLSSGAGTITINATNASWDNGSTYDLIDYGGGLIGGTGFSAFTKGTITGIGARQSATLGDSGLAITLSIAGDLPYWTGAGNGVWTAATQTPKNWKLQTGGTATDFITSDTVLFDDNLTGSPNVSIAAGGVAPVATTFNNFITDYTVTAAAGAGITTGSLTKNGFATLTLGGTHSYTGPTTLNDGVTNLTGTLGNTAVTVGTTATLNLKTAGAINQNTLTVNGIFAQTVDNAISGTAAVVLNNGATFTNPNTYSGGTTLTSGALNLNQGAGIGTGALTITGGTIDNTSAGPVTLTNNNPEVWTSNIGFNFTGTNALNLGTGTVSLGVDASTGNFTITNNSALVGTSLTIAGPITAGVGGAPGIKTLNITGTGVTSLTGNLTMGSATGFIVNDNLSGTLVLSGAASSITTLNLNGGATGIVELGAGNLTVSNGGGNTVQSTTGGTINGTGGGSIVLGSNLGDFGTAGGTTLTVNAKITGNNGIDFYNAQGGAGLGTIIVNGALTHTGVTNVQNTHVILNTPINGANLANQGQVTVGDGALAAVLDINGVTINATKTTSPSVAAGTAATANGAINLNSGTINSTNELWLGTVTGGYGILNQNAGAVSVGSWLAIGRSATGIYNVNNGTLTVTGQNITLGSFTGGYGILNLAGGTTTVTNTGANQGELMIGESAVGQVNLSGNATLTLSGARGVRFGVNATGNGILNLNGTSTLTTPIVQRVAGTGTLNFSGGTLKATTGTASGATFLTGLTAAYIRSGGAIIDDGGGVITIAQPLLAPTGNGVASIAFTGGTGYIGAPSVQISGDGTGATAIANVDSNGNLTGITITNPGVNYTTASVNLVGGAGIAPSIDSVNLAATPSGGLNKKGAGTLNLTGLNTYTGTTTIEAGVLNAGVTGALGSGPVVITPTAVRLLVTDGATLANSITINGGAPGVGLGLIQGSGTGTSTINGPISITATTTNGGLFAGGGGTLVLNGPITSSVPVTSRLGTVVFSGGGSYTAMNLTDTPRIGANDGISTSAVVDLGTSGPATLDLSGFNQQLAGLTRLVANTATLTNSSATASTLNLNVAGANNFAYPGVLAGNLGLRKTGTGTESLGGVNTYTGVTSIESGTLVLTGSLSGSTLVSVAGGATFDVSGVAGGFSVAAGQTLGGTGTVTGAVGLSAGAKLSPGFSPGTLTFNNNVTLTGAVTGTGTTALVFELGTTSDKVVLPTATLDIGSGVLAFDDFLFSDGGGLALGTYTLFDTNTTILGTLDPTAANLTGSVGGYTGTLGLADSGHDLVLTVVPEPGTALSLLGGLGMLLGLRRRRQS